MDSRSGNAGAFAQPTFKIFVSFVLFVDKPLFKRFVDEKHEQEQKIKTGIPQMRRSGNAFSARHLSRGVGQRCTFAQPTLKVSVRRDRLSLALVL